MAERNNLPVPEEPDFSTQIEEILPEDPVHAAQINEIFTRLLTNDAFLDKLASKMVEKALIAHVLDSVNPNMVLGADQAPVLTGLIDEQKERITKLYSDLNNSIIIGIDSTDGEVNLKEMMESMWNNLPELKPFIGILYHGFYAFYAGILYPGRNYGAVIIIEVSGIVSIVNRYNGTFSLHEVNRTRVN